MNDHTLHLYARHGKIRALEGKGQELAAILLEAAALVSTAKGCRLYMVSREEAHPEDIWVTEVWESRDDHARSLQMEEVKALISRARPLLGSEPPSSQELQVLGGSGLR